MSVWQAVLFGIIEGITEFLPVSSTGHLTIAERLLGFRIDDPGVTAFTAIIQSGAVLAVTWYFRRDIIRLGSAWLKGVLHSSERGADYHFGWAVLLGSLPIGFAGLLLKDQAEGAFRSLWLVGGALIAWSIIMWLADHAARLNRGEGKTTWRDTAVIGFAQCLALVPGISRSGATMAAGLSRGLDRVTVTRLSFFLSIPALLAAAAFELASQAGAVSSGVGWTATAIATVVSFLTAYVCIAWLLSYVSKHTFQGFIVYRLLLGAALLGMLLTHRL